MEKTKATAKDFVLWVGAMASLYAGVVAFIALMFDYINTVFPNPVSNTYYYSDPYLNSGMSYEIASLIVLTPVFLVLMRLIRRDIADDSSRNDIWVRRWALFLTLFVAGAAMIIDLIVLLTTFLQGEELTAGFLLKVATVLLVAGLGFLHFFADMRGYWEREPKRARLVNYGVGVIVLIAIIAGFFIVGTPSEIRMKKQDAIRLSNLQEIQWQIVNYWQQKEELPATLADLGDPISGNVIPVDPETGEAYEYKATGARSFEICATFAAAGDSASRGATKPMADPSMAPGALMEDNWAHDAGRDCFTRTIDPERYPPYTKVR